MLRGLSRDFIKVLDWGILYVWAIEKFGDNLVMHDDKYYK